MWILGLRSRASSSSDGASSSGHKFASRNQATAVTVLASKPNMSRKRALETRRSTRATRATWSSEDIRKLYHFKEGWQLQNPGEDWKPMFAFGDVLFPQSTDKQIHSFCNCPKFLNYCAEHASREQLGGRVLETISID